MPDEIEKVVPKFQRDGERGGRIFAEGREARLRAALREARAKFDMARHLRDDNRPGDADEYAAEGEAIIRAALADEGERDA